VIEMAEEKMRKSGKLVDLKKLEAVIEDGDGTGFSFGLFIGISALGRHFSSSTSNKSSNNSIRQRKYR
jgi:hypothetical protein